MPTRAADCPSPEIWRRRKPGYTSGSQKGYNWKITDP